MSLYWLTHIWVTGVEVCWIAHLSDSTSTCHYEKQRNIEKKKQHFLGFYHQAFLFFRLPLDKQKVVIEPQPERHPAPLFLLCCITVWEISSPSLLVRSRYEKSHILVYLSRRRAGISSAASTSLSRHNSPGQHPCASLSGPGANPPPPPPALPPPAHLARLSLWQCPPLLPRSRLS